MAEATYLYTGIYFLLLFCIFVPAHQCLNLYILRIHVLYVKLDEYAVCKLYFALFQWVYLKVGK